ncbi:TonB-dependent receptor family protein [Fusobacterium varium]|uniref:TonB-dependent receptor family protein n=1 Tax=Fusobacterium varium TaxID=856 RepID=UPI001F3BCF16|nr:TonB-dependent receptor [Fusobacterium varium]MCF2672100.1 TonB-dependent receptor [Fusobacterium varium]
MKKTLMLAAILAVGTSMTAMAEENIASQRLNETVITTGESFGSSIHETAKNVTVITSEEIKERGAATVDEALKGVPGVTIRKMDGASPMIDLRGSGATAKYNTIVLLDGIPLNGVAGFNINQIPIAEVERIEVIQGGGAVMYGDGAIGGVVNIITKAPENKINYGSVGLEAGSWETTRANLSYGTKIGDKLLLNASYSGYSSMDYRDRNTDYKNDEDKRESVWLRGKYLLKDGNIELRYNHNEIKDYYTGYLEKNQYDKDPTKPGSYGGVMHNITDIWNLSYNKKLTNKLDLLVYGGYYEDESKNQNQLTKEYYIKPQLKYSYEENSYIIIGGDYRDGNREFKTPVFVNGKIQKAPDDERESYAGYIMNKTTFGKLQLTQGYRREKVKYKYSTKTYGAGWVLQEITPHSSDYSNNDSFELGANYLYSDSGNVYFNYTRAIRTPTIGDAGAWSGDVKTQENDVYELGIRDMVSNTVISTSVFYIDSDNEIYYDKTDANTSTNRNFDGTVRRIGAQLSLIHYFDKLTLRENISYVEPKVTSGIYDGNEFAGVAKWQGNIGATYNITNNLLINGDVYYVGKSYAEDDFDNYFGKDNDYITIDANISYTLDNGLEIYGGVRNLFDEEYCNTITSTRSTYAPGPRKVYYPADGRSFYAGFKYNF